MVFHAPLCSHCPLSAQTTARLYRIKQAWNFKDGGPSFPKGNLNRSPPGRGLVDNTRWHFPNRRNRCLLGAGHRVKGCPTLHSVCTSNPIAQASERKVLA